MFEVWGAKWLQHAPRYWWELDSFKYISQIYNALCFLFCILLEMPFFNAATTLIRSTFNKVWNCCQKYLVTKAYWERKKNLNRRSIRRNLLKGNLPNASVEHRVYRLMIWWVCTAAPYLVNPKQGKKIPGCNGFHRTGVSWCGLRWNLWLVRDGDLL
jgi:hypothetical protein